ncbi:hypothetical protein HK102_007999, partial [Quaeritorhiza haematococci]
MMATNSTTSTRRRRILHDESDDDAYDTLGPGPPPASTSSTTTNTTTMANPKMTPAAAAMSRRMGSGREGASSSTTGMGTVLMDRTGGANRGLQDNHTHNGKHSSRVETPLTHGNDEEDEDEDGYDDDDDDDDGVDPEEVKRMIEKEEYVAKRKEGDLPPRDKRMVAHLRLLTGGNVMEEKVFPVFTGVTTVGRDDACDITLVGISGVSGTHAMIDREPFLSSQIFDSLLSVLHRWMLDIATEISPDGIEHFIEDLNSTNGVSLGPAEYKLQPLKCYQITHRRIILFGPAKCVYEYLNPRVFEEAIMEGVDVTAMNDNKMGGLGIPPTILITPQVPPTQIISIPDSPTKYGADDEDPLMIPATLLVDTGVPPTQPLPPAATPTPSAAVSSVPPTQLLSPPPPIAPTLPLQIGVDATLPLPTSTLPLPSSTPTPSASTRPRTGAGGASTSTVEPTQIVGGGGIAPTQIISESGVAPTQIISRGGVAPTQIISVGVMGEGNAGGEGESEDSHPIVGVGRTRTKRRTMLVDSDEEHDDDEPQDGNDGGLQREEDEGEPPEK